MPFTLPVTWATPARPVKVPGVPVPPVAIDFADGKQVRAERIHIVGPGGTKQTAERRKGLLEYRLEQMNKNLERMNEQMQALQRELGKSSAEEDEEEIEIEIKERRRVARQAVGLRPPTTHASKPRECLPWVFFLAVAAVHYVPQEFAKANTSPRAPARGNRQQRSHSLALRASISKISIAIVKRSAESLSGAAPMSQTRTVGIFIFPDVEVLDFCGPFEVFSVAGRQIADGTFRAITVAKSPEMLLARNGLKVVPDYTWDNAPPIDLLLIPGGQGTRPLIHDAPTIEWIQRQATKAELVLSVCTGALLLAKAGLLDGLSATTHHGAIDLLKELRRRQTSETTPASSTTAE